MSKHRLQIEKATFLLLLFAFAKVTNAQTTVVAEELNSNEVKKRLDQARIPRHSRPPCVWTNSSTSMPLSAITRRQGSEVGSRLKP